MRAGVVSPPGLRTRAQARRGHTPHLCPSEPTGRWEPGRAAQGGPQASWRLPRTHGRHLCLAVFCEARAASVCVTRFPVRRRSPAVSRRPGPPASAVCGSAGSAPLGGLAGLCLDRAFPLRSSCRSREQTLVRLAATSLAACTCRVSASRCGRTEAPQVSAGILQRKKNPRRLIRNYLPGSETEFRRRHKNRFLRSAGRAPWELPGRWDAARPAPGGPLVDEYSSRAFGGIPSPRRRVCVWKRDPFPPRSLGNGLFPQPGPRPPDAALGGQGCWGRMSPAGVPGAGQGRREHPPCWTLPAFWTRGNSLAPCRCVSGHSPQRPASSPA